MIRKTQYITKKIIIRSAKKARAIAVGRRRFLLNIDSPRGHHVGSRKTTIDGWIIPLRNNEKVYSIRLLNGNKTYAVKYPIKRPDVASAHTNLDKDKVINSGFTVEIELQDGDIDLEMDFGNGFELVKRLSVHYSKELLYEDYLNPNLSENMARHLTLIANKQQLYYEQSSKEIFNRHKNDPRLLAFYLPQFHSIKQNNEVWGEGFTEWTNVTTASPRFVGHQQPILPSDLGFYDLSYERTIKKQIDLAKKYGVYGFCFYYYWFSGEKILDKPLDIFLAKKDWDFNFTICWANENWTKRWDGRDSEIIIAQKYREEDPLAFIKDVEHILNDPRYIAEDGKPVLVVYRASELKDPAKYAKIWRKYFKEVHNKELYLVSVLSFDAQDPTSYGFDAALDFAPLTTFFKHKVFSQNKLPFIEMNSELLDPNFEGMVVDYRSVALNPKLYDTFSFPTYKCVMPSWDNDARKKGKGFVYYNANPDIYAKWLDNVLEIETKKSKSPMVFINAWNEWAEGTILEPSLHLGHTTLKRTAEKLAKYSHNPENRIKFSQYEINKKNDLAILVHLYYPERWAQIMQRLTLLDDQYYDLFVSINEKDVSIVEELKAFKPDANIYIVPNRGRDVLPFLNILNKLKESKYKYILKIHSKKSLHRSDGSDWFSDILEKLIPDKDTINKIITTLSKEETGIIGPRGHLVSLKRHMGSNKNMLSSIITQAYSSKMSDKVLSSPEKYPFFGGTMFWARIDALEKIGSLYLGPEDFSAEMGQVDGTTAHALERLFGIAPILEGKRIFEVGKSDVVEVQINRVSNAKYKYAD